MNTQDSGQSSGSTSPQNSGNQQNIDPNQGEQKMAANPNPRANENIKQAPFDKSTGNNPIDEVGSEITDGEDA